MKGEILIERLGYNSINKDDKFKCFQVIVAQLCPTLCNPSTAVCQAPLSMRFSRQEYWSESFPSPGDLQLFATHGLQFARLFCPWDFPGKNTGVSHSLLQGIFLT